MFVQLTSVKARATAAALNPFRYAGPGTHGENVAFANASAYEWSYYDTCREQGVTPLTVPDGWAFAWTEYVRRNASSRMAIREAFRQWRDYGTLPGLD
jgi:hypothetical protein